MEYFGIALVIAALIASPVFLAGSYVGGGIVALAFTTLLWWLLYGGADGFAGPMFGAALPLAVVASIVIMFFTRFLFHENGRSIGKFHFVPPLVLGIALISILISGSEMLNAEKYRALIGQMENRVWTQDVQPKDPEHFRPVSHENAIYVAKKVVGELGTIGSQFQIQENSLTLQVIGGELWYVIPLDFAGFRSWFDAEVSVGYIKVHAEDPNRQPIVKQLPREKQFAYTPGAWFGKNLVRHLRQSGNLFVNLNGTHLEIDDNDNAWWITSVLVPTIGQFGDKVTGVLITNPVTGASTFSPIGKVPEWVDRVVPRDLVHNNLGHWGEYVHSWWNSVWRKRDLTEPEKPSLVFSDEKKSVYVTGVTSQNARDDSLVGVVYTDTHTGKSVYYEVKGGATDEAVLQAMSKFQDIQFKKLHATDPQIYNLYGTMASVAPLMNENHAYSGVAIANINNVQQIATGRSLAEAVRQYQRILGQSGDFAHLEKEKRTKVAEAVILRIKQDIAPSGSVYYVVLRDIDKAFVGGSGEFPLLPLADAGDRVRVGYYATNESIVPMVSFDNLTLKITKSIGQTSAKGRAMESRDANEMKPTRRDVEERVKKMSPDEMRALQKALEK